MAETMDVLEVREARISPKQTRNVSRITYPSEETTLPTVTIPAGAPASAHACRVWIWRRVNVRSSRKCPTTSGS